MPTNSQLDRLVEIMRRLRAEGGCPWDREQDLRSLRPYLVEETFEVLDEMDRVAYGGSWKPYCEELGDLLFQIVFHAQLATELGEFTMEDVCRAIADKIESRHPHVFGDVSVQHADQVLNQWAKLKAEEKKKKAGRDVSVLDGVPSAAPALLRAERLTEKASRIGFDWENVAQVRAKLDEELRELDEAIVENDRDHLEHELGDVLFCLANLSRFIKTPAEDALRQANRRFTSRFGHVEESLRQQNVPFGTATLEQMNGMWNQAKHQEHLMPPPRTHFRGTMLAVPLYLRDVPSSREFYEKLTPHFGWQIRSTKQTFTIDMHGFLVRASHDERRAGNAEFELEAPSQAAVDALYKQLQAWNLSSLESPRRTHQNYGVSFLDLERNRWSYLFHPETRPI